MLFDFPGKSTLPDTKKDTDFDVEFSLDLGGAEG
jgi:hypothetical protein